MTALTRETTQDTKLILALPKGRILKAAAHSPLL